MIPRPDTWLLALLAASSGAIGALVLFQAVSVVREWRLRADILGGLSAEGTDRRESRPQASLLRGGADQDKGPWEAWAERVPFLWDLHHLLGQSGLSWTLPGLVARVVASGGFLGLLILAASGSTAMAVLGFLVGAYAPYVWVRLKKKQRVAQMETQLPDTIDLIARAVRAGHPLSEGLRMAAEEAPEPLASEFRVTFEEQRFGLPFDDALLGLGDRVEVVDVRILVTAVLVQREVGGNLTEILEQIATTMRARFTLKRQVQVYTAQGRMSGYTLAALPILVGLAISVINPDYIRVLFAEPLGQAMLGGAAVLQVIGFLWIRRIIDIRY